MTPRELANEHSRKHNARTTSGGSDAPKKIRELQERINRLEEAGDETDGRIGCGCGCDGPCSDCRSASEKWNKAKEAKL
jgi:hypothetical protein